MAKKKNPRAKVNPQASASYDKGELFDAFISTMAFERSLWEVNCKVFLTNPRNMFAPAFTRGDALHFAARNLFGVLAQACNIAMMAGIASFLDPKESQVRKQLMPNLVVERVIEDLGPPPYTPERAAIDKDLAEIKRIADPIRNSRNKVGAHRDLFTNIAISQHYLQGAPYPLKKITVGQVEDIMDRLFRITDAIVKHNRPGTIWYDTTIEIDNFFDVLSYGIKGAATSKRASKSETKG